MAVREGSVVVNATQQQVYDYVSNPVRHPEWGAHDTRVTPAPGTTGNGPGAVYHTYANVLGGLPGEMRVLAAEPPSRFVVQTRDKSGTFEFAFLLAPEGTGTRLTYRMTPLKVNPVLNLLVGLIFWPLVGKPSFQQTLGNLKTKTEAAARAG